MANQTKILNTKQVEQKINRIAYQIYEENVEFKKVVLVGIEGQGKVIAERISKALNRISDLKVIDATLQLDKKNPLEHDIQLSIDSKELADKSVILVDDVLNSGKTLMYAVRFLLSVPLKNLTTAILVDRKHRRFPVQANFVGMSLSTTMQEHISVELSAQSDHVFLE